jgi:hypothetical protein
MRRLFWNFSWGGHGLYKSMERLSEHTLLFRKYLLILSDERKGFSLRRLKGKKSEEACIHQLRPLKAIRQDCLETSFLRAKHHTEEELRSCPAC